MNTQSNPTSSRVSDRFQGLRVSSSGNLIWHRGESGETINTENYRDWFLASGIKLTINNQGHLLIRY